MLAQVQALRARVVWDDRAHELLDVTQVEILVLSAQRERPPSLARTSCTPDTMDVVLRLVRHVKIQHVGDLGNVDAASEHVGRDENAHLAVHELRKRPRTLVLRAVAVNRGAADARPAQNPAHLVRAVLSLHEHDHAVGSLSLEQLGEQALLGLGGHAEHILPHRLGGGPLRRDLHTHGVSHQRTRLREHVFGERRREQQRLAVPRRSCHNLAHVRQKAHVEHTIGLIEHQDLDLPERAGALVEQVDQAAGRRHKHVAATCERILLRLVAHAAHHDRGPMSSLCSHRLGDVRNLLRQLTCGRDDQHERPLSSPSMPKTIQRGQQEGRGLSRPRLCCGHDVFPLEHGGDGLRLDGGRLVVSHAADRSQRRLGKPKILKRPRVFNCLLPAPMPPTPTFCHVSPHVCT